MRPARHWRLRIAALVAVLALALTATGFHGRMSDTAFRDLQERAENTLGLAEATLRGQLSRFERLPGLIADQELVRELLKAPRDAGLVDQTNRYLKETAERLGASDIYVMYRDGETLAASNFDMAHSFVGGNFAFRPYFFNALDGGEGRFFALGTTSNKRGYYFGAGVEIEGEVPGVLVIKVDVDEIENAWSSNDLRIVVTDPEGIVFLSNRPDWLFRALGPLPAENLARTRETRRYANAEVGEVPARFLPGPGGLRLLRTGTGDGPETEYLVVEAFMPEADWTVKVLSPTRGAREQALVRIAAALLALAVAGFAGHLVWQRRRQMAERLAVQQAAKAELESRVAERTSQLATANRALQDEIGERIAAEARLRRTQAELVQAGKLAALGQMSAALSHEFNQPLAAARNYAENADLLLQRGRVAEAQENLGRIIGTMDRMGRISRHLRNFARKPNRQLRPVALNEVVAATEELLGWRLRKVGAVLETDLGEAGLSVTAGPVRLQQVLVNLIGNALDAIEDADDRRLHLCARREGDQVEITLRDHGPGVPEHLHERIFDPFFSTKGVGKGLGLGLSISFNIVSDFGGRLSLRNHPEGGAEFSLRLRAADRIVLEDAS